MATKEYNAAYYARRSSEGLITFTLDELRPSTILELIGTLNECGVHQADKRVTKLREKYKELTGEEIIIE